MPSTGVEEFRVVDIGSVIEVDGWTLRVTEAQDAGAGLQIITPGYEGAQSSRLRVEVTAVRREVGALAAAGLLERRDKAGRQLATIPATVARPLDRGLQALGMLGGEPG